MCVESKNFFTSWEKQKMSENSGLFTIVCTIALGGAILYLLQRIRRTDKELKLLHLQTRQIVDVGEIKGIVHKVLQSTPTTLPPNFNSIVERITREKIDDLHEQTSRTVGGEVEEEKVKTQEYKEHVVQQEERRETLSFDDQHTDGVSVSGSIQRLAKHL